ncbi:hypothetical protein [Streptomyces sp. NPDC001717]|uniref:hypothetical protein n=1 Tax=Streptomyces sp. NPDC001717 TaxID=3364604 RepID=UPI0036CEB609
MTQRNTKAKTTGRILAAGLLCAVLVACGTGRAGQASGPAPVPSPTSEKCALDVPTEEQTGGYAGPPTDQETGGYAGPPTDQETGGYAGPPTDQETGAYAGPPTDQDTGSAGPPTDGDTTTDAEIGNGGGPCGPADWFDMTRDFTAYAAAHRAEHDEFLVRQTRVRKVRTVGEANILFSTAEVGKGRGDTARRIAELFSSWRHEVYGDHGTLVLRTGDGSDASDASAGIVITERW